MGAIWIQIGTNFFNDAIDADKGADTEKRLGPKRATASGLLSRRCVYLTAACCLLIAALFGWELYRHCGWPIIAIGIPSLYLCYGYTGGPVPLAYRGLGELFVILFFGLVAVTGSVFVQIGEWRAEAVLLGLQVGLLSAVLISINNLRDRQEDLTNNKRTLAVKWGEHAAKVVVLVEVLAAFALCFAWYLFRIPSVGVLSAGFIVLGSYILAHVMSEPPSERYNRYLAFGGLQLILFACLFTTACLIK